MNGVWCFDIWLDLADIDCVGDRDNLEMHGSICVDLQYLMRPTERGTHICTRYPCAALPYHERDRYEGCEIYFRFLLFF